MAAIGTHRETFWLPDDFHLYHTQRTVLQRHQRGSTPATADSPGYTTEQESWTQASAQQQSQVCSHYATERTINSL